MASAFLPQHIRSEDIFSDDEMKQYDPKAWYKKQLVALANAYRAETSNYYEHQRLDTNFTDCHTALPKMGEKEALAYAERVIATPGHEDHAYKGFVPPSPK